MDKINEGMSNNTTCFSCANFPISQGSEYDIREGNSYRFRGTLASSIFIAILSPVAVAGNTLILAVIWKKTFQRIFFHILLSGLAFSDLCTGLIAQPVYAVTILLTSVNERAPIDRPRLYKTFGTIADASATYFICVTILILTVMSVERWLHMSRRSLVTSIRGCLTATVVFIIPAPLVVFRSLETLNPGTTGRELNIMNMMIMLFCFLTMVVAYCKVLRIIHSQQLNVEALNASSHNFGKPVINLAKYRRSIITVLHILAVFSFCFLPYIISVGAYVRVGLNWETEIALSVSTVFLFLTSSVNPGLYLWRMSDVRNGVKQLFCSHN